MIKKNKKIIIITSILTLLPMFIGLLLWIAFPQSIIGHLGMTKGNITNGLPWIPVVVLPLIMLLVHWFCIIFTFTDPQNQEQSSKVINMIYYIAPVTSICSSIFVILVSSDSSFSFESILFVGLGLMFIVVGNYLPKCKQNATIGIKSIWALEDEENWNATHRLSGKIWVIGGLLVLLCGFLPKTIWPFFLIIGIFLMSIVPFLYSYLFNRKKVKSGQDIMTSSVPKANMKLRYGISVVLFIFIIGAVIITGVTGNITYQYNAKSVEVETIYWSNITISYEDMDSVEYISNSDAGSRTNGFGSGRLLLGSFENDNYGKYTRYTYTKPKHAVLVTIAGKKYVLNAKDDAETEKLYNTLHEEMK